MTLRHLVLSIITCFFVSGLVAQPDVFFQIRNTQVVNNTYSFDVHMRASQSGTYHSRGQVYFFYNPSAFGNTVVQNNKVTVTEMDLLTEPDLFGGTKYLTINVVDNGNRVAVTWQMVYQTIPASSLTHTMVPDTFTPLYHFEMVMQNTSLASGVYLDYALMGSQQYYLYPNEITEQQYNFPLPVSWTHFSADKVHDRNVELSWGTESETNNAWFEIEKARGDGDFEMIGRVEGAGTSFTVNDYRFLDQTGMDKRNIYRIKQVDLDGNYSYSEVIEVTFGYFGKDKFSAFPIPLQDKLTLQAYAKEEVPYYYCICDVYGKQIMGGVLGAFEQQTSFSVADLAPGSYLLTIQSPGRQQQVIRLSK
ncbi:MAG: hypothetical protein R3B47_00350 [Bacteroidia bacterium]